MVRVNYVEVDEAGTPAQLLGVSTMPHAPREKEIVRLHHIRDQLFVVTRVAYHLVASAVMLTNQEGQSTPELTFNTCEVQLRRLEPANPD